MPHGEITCANSCSSRTSWLSSVILVQHPMAKAVEDKEEVEEARREGSQTYLALRQHLGDEEDQTRAQICA